MNDRIIHNIYKPVNFRTDITQVNIAKVTTDAYRAYCQKAGKLGLPQFQQQDEKVRNSWLTAVETYMRAGERSGHQLYNRFYEAVGGVAIHNDQVRLLPFDELPAITQAAWQDAAHAIY